MGKIFTKIKINTRKFLDACYAMKEGANGKNNGSTMISKAQQVRNVLFPVSTPKGIEATCVCLPLIE